MDAKPHIQMWFVAAWFTTSVTALIFAVVLSVFLTQVKIVNPVNQNFKLYISLPKTTSETSDSVKRSDARSKIIEDFFRGYNSNLADFSDIFTGIADKYQLDWRLLPSIAMQESNGGKKIIQGSFNPFGYGIYGDLVIKFTSFEQAIERVGKGLREDYLNKGLITPEQIMTKYTPPSLKKGGAWAKGVSTFMEELR